MNNFSNNSFLPPIRPPGSVVTPVYPTSQVQYTPIQHLSSGQTFPNLLLSQYQSIPQYTAYISSVPNISPIPQNPTPFISDYDGNNFFRPPATFPPPTTNIPNQPFVAPPISQLPSNPLPSTQTKNRSQNKLPIQSNINSNTSNGRQSDDLRISIQTFVKTLEDAAKYGRNRQVTSEIDSSNLEEEGAQQISILSNRFHIKRRRLYDVLHVFEAIGCVKKSGLDSVKWIGKENIVTNLHNLKEQRGINDPSKTLDEIFPDPCHVGISNLTIYFLLLFFAIKQDKVDIRYASQFFSRNTTRYKTTLCKLYQICYILGSIDVTSRTSQVCEIILNSPYYDDEVVPADPSEEETPIEGELAIKTEAGNNPQSIDMSIQSLLNPPKENSESLKRKPPSNLQFIYNRRRELRNYYTEFVKKTEELPIVSEEDAFK